MRRSLVLSIAAVLALAAGAYVIASSGATDRTGGADVPPLRVAAAPDEEATLLAHVLAALLQADGIDAEVVPFADARDGQQAIELGAVDVRPGYTGEAWLETLGRADPPDDPRASFGPVRAQEERRGVVWLRPRFGDGLDEPPANATFAFVVAGPPAADADLRTISQLAGRLGEQPDARVCVDLEFGRRRDGLRAVLEAYRVRSDRPFVAANPEEAVLGVVAGDCIAGLTTATDGAAWARGLRPLLDDLGVFPAFVPLPQVRAEVLEERPQVRAALRPFTRELTTMLLGNWNARLDAGTPLEQVANDAAMELRARAEQA